MNKKIAMAITLCCCVIGMSACGKAAVEGQHAAASMEQTGNANEKTAATEVADKTSSCEIPPKILIWSDSRNLADGQSSEQEPQDILPLSFKQTAVTGLLPKNANEDWTVTKEIQIGDAAIILYEDKSGEDYALARYESKFYDLGGVYNVENIRTQKLDGSFGDIELIGGIGTDFTRWDVLGMDKQSNKLVSFQTIGRPEMTDLEGDGSEELIAGFNGAHLHFPNVEILRLNGSEIESAEMVDQTHNGEDQQFARVSDGDSDIVFEIGKVSGEGTVRSYIYRNGQLIANWTIEDAK